MEPHQCVLVRFRSKKFRPREERRIGIPISGHDGTTERDRLQRDCAAPAKWIDDKIAFLSEGANKS